jgi:hypothetical protein
MKFEPNRPFESPEPTVDVDAGLPPGSHRFRLVVFNRRGQPSQPSEVVVTIERFGPTIPSGIPRPGPNGGVGPSSSFPP